MKNKKQAGIHWAEEDNETIWNVINKDQRLVRAKLKAAAHDK